MIVFLIHAFNDNEHKMFGEGTILETTIDKIKKNALQYTENGKYGLVAIERHIAGTEGKSNKYDRSWYEFRNGKLVDIPQPERFDKYETLIGV